MKQYRLNSIAITGSFFYIWHMRQLIPALAIPLLLLFNQNITGGNTGSHTPAFQTGSADSSTWIAAFKEFREAVFRKDKVKVKEFFRFPVMNEANEIWFIAYADEKKISALPSKIKPFTEKDFDKYYDKLISKSFITALLKIKSDVLFKKGETETIELKEGKKTTYKMYASVDKATKILSLNLAFNTMIKDENGEIQDGGESNIIYQFKVISNSKIIFKQIRIAG